MANETLVLRKGLLANLANAPVVEGALSFTTDEPAIYIDVDGKHLRIGDIKEFANLEALRAYLSATPEKIPTTGLYYAIAENALMKYTGSAWQQINVNYSGDITSLQNQITAISTTIGDKPEGWSDASLWAAISKNRTDIATNTKNISDEIARADAEEKRLAGLIADNATAVATEKSRAEGVEAGLSTAIANEASRADTEEKRLAGLIADNTAAIAVNTGDITTLKGNVSDLNANKADKSSVYTKTEVDATVQGLSTSITNLSNDKADKSSVYTKTEVDGFVQGAKDHSDANLATAKSYADGKLVEAKAYTDEKVGAVSDTLTGFQTSVNESLSGINGEIANLKTADTNIGLRIDGVVSRVEAVESGKADKADTLAGYGIANAYTSTQVDEKIAEAVAAFDAANGSVVGDVQAIQAAIAMSEVPEGKTVIGLINEAKSEASAATAKALEDANKHADEAVAAEKSRAEGAEAGLSSRIDTVAGDLTKLGTDLRKEFADADTAQTQAITAAYEAYVDGKLRAADAMRFMGVIDDDNALPTTGVEAGDTYKVGVNTTVNGEKVYVGDLVIANSDQGEEASYSDWSIVHSGYEDDHDVHVELNNGVVEIINAAGASRGSVKVEGNYSDANGGVKVTLSSVDADPATPGVEVTAKFEMIWGSF